MTEPQLKIIIRAVGIRLKRGQDIEDILDSYPKLSVEERELIRNYYINI